jgi:predicted nucleic acid-binding protein
VSVVSNTSPLNYLILIGAADILPRLYGTVIVPTAVVDELRATGAPDSVAAWMKQIPGWLRVQELATIDEGLDYLGAGEQSAIALATQTGSALLIDDRDGRREAEQRGLQVIGTLGIIGDAATAGLLRLSDIVERLQKTNFRASPKLFKALLDRSP